MKIVSLTETFDVSVPIQAMSPIVVDKDFTKNYLDDSESIYPKIVNRLCRSFDRAPTKKTILSLKVLVMLESVLYLIYPMPKWQIF